MIFTLLAILLSPSAGAASDLFEAKGACTPGEKWALPATFVTTHRGELEGFLAHKTSSARSFGEALSLRRQVGASSSALKTFSEYWLARSLFEAKLTHAAWSGFRSVLSDRHDDPLALGVQLAALECMNRIHTKYSSFAYEAADLPALQKISAKVQGEARLAEPLWVAAGILHRTLVSQGVGADRKLAAVSDGALALLPRSGHHSNLARGMLAAARFDHPTAIRELETFLTDPGMPEWLRSQTDSARILLSHSLFAIHQYDRSAEELKKITKTSNELAGALSALAWAYLQNDRYGEAIGTAMNLNAGGLKHTFAPEGPMVMAMALNELCQYPESIKAVALFRSSYEGSYKYLKGMDKTGALYPQAVNFLATRGKAGVPDRVASEWVRSPVFISRQEQINVLRSERGFGDSWKQRFGAETQIYKGELLKMAGELRAGIKKYRSKTPYGQPLTSGLQQDLKSLRAGITHFNRMRRSIPLATSVVARAQAEAPARERKLVAEIESDLRRRSARMLEVLDDVAENNQFVEVEIFNGASHDIVWQNAHPEYKEAVRKLASEDSGAPSAAVTWDWGRTDGEEIWEDELGSFRADLFDNCSSKEKYLAIRKRT